ncbi:MAG TPA: hypothetical protein VH988_07885 [Thermoanaerobaculia bacterium]|jgi:hypothetical protein|nr:hypothetical protein [Thermoanaerobaculia bacterium]
MPMKFFESIARYDLLFANVDAAGQLSTLFLSAEEIPDVSTFKRDLESRYPNLVEISEGLGSIGLVGFGLGSRPVALHEVMRVIRQRGIQVLEAFTSRESLAFIVPVSRVEEGVLLLHRAFVEECAAPRACADGPPVVHSAQKHQESVSRSRRKSLILRGVHGAP